MEAPSLYNKIRNAFEQHIRYTHVIAEKEKDLTARKADIAKILIESEFEADVEQTAFEVFTEIGLYRNDLRITNNKLYIMVDAYTDLENVEPKLPEEITSLCRIIEKEIPKNNFSVTPDMKIVEKDKDFIQKVKRAQVKSGAMKNLVEELKNMLDV